MSVRCVVLTLDITTGGSGVGERQYETVIFSIFHNAVLLSCSTRRGRAAVSRLSSLNRTWCRRLISDAQPSPIGTETHRGQQKLVRRAPVNNKGINFRLIRESLIPNKRVRIEVMNNLGIAFCSLNVIGLWNLAWRLFFADHYVLLAMVATRIVNGKNTKL